VKKDVRLGTLTPERRIERLYQREVLRIVGTNAAFKERATDAHLPSSHYDPNISAKMWQLSMA
jgi:hypothetical protein